MGFSIPSLTTLPRVHLALGGGFSGGVLRSGGRGRPVSPKMGMRPPPGSISWDFRAAPGIWSQPSPGRLATALVPSFFPAVCPFHNRAVAVRSADHEGMKSVCTLFGPLASMIVAAALPDGPHAEVAASRGQVMAELFYRQVPMTVANYVGLAEGVLGQVAEGDAEGFVGIEVADIGSDESTARG